MKLRLAGWVAVDGSDVDMPVVCKELHNNRSCFHMYSATSKVDLALRMGNDIFSKHTYLGEDTWLIIWVDNEFFVHNRYAAYYYINMQ
jgi:hypothetical protein